MQETYCRHTGMQCESHLNSFIVSRATLWITFRIEALSHVAFMRFFRSFLQSGCSSSIRTTTAWEGLLFLCKLRIVCFIKTFPNPCHSLFENPIVVAAEVLQVDIVPRQEWIFSKRYWFLQLRQDYAVPTMNPESKETEYS